MIDEAMRWTVYRRAKGRCEAVIKGRRCNKVTPWTEGHAAHRVAREKSMVRKYGQDRIDHPLNLAWTCPEHNDTVLITRKPVEREALMRRIAEELR